MQMSKLSYLLTYLLTCPLVNPLKVSRGDRIRTCDLVLPKQMTRQSPHYDFE